MKKINYLYIVAASVLLVSCKEDVEKPKVTYDNSAKTQKSAQAKDDAETQIAIVDLPIQIPGTNYLIHPVGGLNIYGGEAKVRYESSSSVNGNISFTISNYSENEIAGYLSNLKFQEIGSDSIKPLSDKPVLIQTATFLKSVSDKTKQQVMVYALADMDTNKDGRLDANDIKSLYMSEISGDRFTKMSADFQELIDWNLIEANNRLYFRTIEDSNKNGEFDRNDVLHYHFIDLATRDWKVSHYNPI